EVRGLRLDVGSSRPIDFALRPGGMVGMAGLIGAGRSELAETLFGIRAPVAGEVRLDGRPVRLRTPAEAIQHGIFLLPEDRRVQGLVLAESVRDNVTLPWLDRVSRAGLISRAREPDLAEDARHRL